MFKSPCINICEIDLETSFSLGCGRSLNQITNWINYTEKEKNNIIKNLKKNNLLKLKSK
mgnify:FL=1|jgi:uncharacterized protein